MMQELGLTISAATAAERYGSLLSGYVVDPADAGDMRGLAAKVKTAPTLMTDLATREALARAVLDLADTLAARR